MLLETQLMRFFTFKSDDKHGPDLHLTNKPTKIWALSGEKSNHLSVSIMNIIGPESYPNLVKILSPAPHPPSHCYQFWL